jgi:hypothetical protein
MSEPASTYAVEKTTAKGTRKVFGGEAYAEYLKD